MQQSTSPADPSPHATPPLPLADSSHEKTVISENAKTEQEASRSSHVPTSDDAGQSDPSLSTSHTGGEKDETSGKDQGSWKPTTLTMPVKSRSFRKSGKVVSHGKATTSSSTEKPPSVTANSEGKSSSKKRKISVFRRIVFICTSCITSSARTHEVDIEEGASRPVESERQHTEKPPGKETECVAHATREPSSATTRK